MPINNQICAIIITPMALALFLTFAGASGALAQEVDEFSVCTRLLTSPPLDTLLVQNDGQDYSLLASDQLGKSLLGVKCSRDQIVEFFLNAGWELRGENHIVSESGPSTSRYLRDYGIGFRKPRNFPWRLVYGRYQAISGIFMFEGRITHITSGPAI